jgi:hypothetical protein
MNQIMKEHNEIASLTTKLNKINSMIMFYCYFGVTTVIDLTLYLTFSDQVIFMARMFTLICSLAMFIVSFLAAYNIADESKYAHRPYNKFNSLMARSVNFPLELKLKTIYQK